MDIEISLEVFDLLNSCDVFVRSRREVGSIAFSRLRRAIRGLIVALRDSGDDWIEDQLLRLQRLLAQWLTTPCSFQGDSAEELLSCLSEVERLCARWGGEVKAHIDAALEAAGAIAKSETPLQQETRTVIEAMFAKNRDFRILCHRTVRRHFLDCLASKERNQITDRHFLHSAREYRDCGAFDVLIKVGPLRGEGWGAAPSAILSSPRFRELEQITWYATYDDPNFGLDPILRTFSGDEQAAVNPIFRELPGEVNWTLNVMPCGEEIFDDPENETGIDDLGLLSVAGLAAIESHRSAVLLTLGDRRGILYPPGAFVLVYDPAATADRAISERQVGDDVSRGAFLIWPRVNENATRGSAGASGQLHEIWRSLLSSELASNSSNLARRLRVAGLNLAYPEVAVRNWVRPPSTVVHAPKKKRHFDILMKVLGAHQANGNPRFITDAWTEVRQSRGEAIQAGVHENARLLKLCINVLQMWVDQIPEKNLQSNEFSLELNGEGGLYGTVYFMRIEGVEDGYRLPDTEMRQLVDLDDTVRWRA